MPLPMRSRGSRTQAARRSSPGTPKQEYASRPADDPAHADTRSSADQRERSGARRSARAPTPQATRSASGLSPRCPARRVLGGCESCRSAGGDTPPSARQRRPSQELRLWSIRLRYSRRGRRPFGERSQYRRAAHPCLLVLGPAFCAQFIHARISAWPSSADCCIYSSCGGLSVTQHEKPTQDVLLGRWAVIRKIRLIDRAPLHGPAATVCPDD